MDYMTMNFNRNGGSGTSDYSQLSNKPKINDVTLSGNKTSADLGLMPEYEVDTTPTESSTNLISSGAVWSADKNIKDKLQGSKTAGSTDGSPFEIPDYGMTESIQMYFKPTQDLHGRDKPWAGGAGKNKLPLVLADIKANNTEGTWSGNTYALKGVTFEVLTDSADNVLGVKMNGTGTNDGAGFDLVKNATYPFSGTYIISGSDGFNYGVVVSDIKFTDTSYNTLVESSDVEKAISSNLTQYGLFVWPGATVDTTVYPMIRLSTETDTDFEPYSNICPISGQDNATFSWIDDEDIETEVSMNFGNTYYGGFCQFNGQIYPDWDYIASYNGETLSGEWVSDRDEYTAGTTPTIGAEVAYKTTPSYVRVTPPANLSLTDDYPIEYNGYMASIGYQPKNTVLAEAKEYTNQKLLNAGLPTPPTTDGTYHLECSVNSGNPTITWVLNS